MSNKKETWIQYAYEDTLIAPILQCASNEKEAIKDDKNFPGNPWFQYDLIKTKDTVEAIHATNERGPFYFNKKQ